MRGVGAALVMLSSIGIGLFSAAQKSAHLRSLRSFCEALSYMAGELAGKRSPLPELIDSCGQFANGEARSFFLTLSENLSQLGTRTFQQIWIEAAGRLRLISSEESRELAALGKVLGRMELARQLAAVDSCCRFLTERLDREERLFQRERRIQIGVPIALGAMLSILLL